MIKATAHTDDYAIEVEFDATAYFEQATYEEVAGIAKVDWGGDYETDEVAQYMRGKGGEMGLRTGTLDAMFSHTSSNNGFECYVDDTSALAWLAANRPSYVQRLLVYEIIHPEDLP